MPVFLFSPPQPSQIRFSCLPMSRVECMLKLPSLDLVFSSNRGELETPAGAHPADGPHPPSSTPPGQHVPKLPPSKGLALVLHVVANAARIFIRDIILHPHLSPLQPRRCWEAPWAGAATAAASRTSAARPAPPRASASPPACPTSPSTSSILTAPASRSPPSQACHPALGR